MAQARVPFNLCAETNHDAFVFFDNATKKKSDRLTILVTIRQLQGKDLEETKRQIIELHGEGAVHRRMQEGSTVESAGLEYMKYCIIMHGERPVRIFDMDTLCEVEKASQKKLEKSKAEPIDAADDAEGESRLNLGFQPHVGAISRSTRIVETFTEKHGKVRLRFQIFDDPDVRNAINISVEKNLAIDTCWGSAVKAINPKMLRQRRWFKRPAHISKDKIRKMHENDTYWMTVKGMTEREGEMVETSLTIPRRSRKKFRHYLQDQAFK